MKSHFYAILSRMKNINRWGLMRNTRMENLSEHSLEVAFIAHCLAIIGKKRLGKSINPEKVAVAAMFHDTSEIITGDLPTPIKYYNPDIKKAYKAIEKVANQRLLDMLPEELKEEYEPLIDPNTKTYEYRLVKAADKLSAYIKCVEELKSGNREFAKAEATLRAEVDAYAELPEVKYFCDNFLASFSKTLDELD